MIDLLISPFATLRYAQWLTWFFVFALAANLLLKFWLATRQIRHVAAHSGEVPSAFANKISLEAHQKAASYTIANNQFGLYGLAWGAVTTVGWTLLGGLALLNETLINWLGNGMWQQLALLGGFALIGSLLDLPFSLYQTFVIEERFGFNKSTFRLWMLDLLKSVVLGIAIGLPIAALILWLMASAGSRWWLWAWAVWTVFNLLMLLIYPTWIAPIFNKFKPLEDPELKERVSKLMERCGFKSKGLYVMDGSRRSAHANAYFTGFGASKRVVFFDTLLEQLNAGEVDAVLAHELGHFAHKHIVKRMIGLFGLSLIAFALLGWLSSQSWFYIGLGVTPNLHSANDALALLLFMIFLPLVSTLLTPLFAQLSRKHEFEADAYAASHSSGADLSNALVKLLKDNASTLTPDPLYVQFYYSHPTVPERMARLQ